MQISGGVFCNLAVSQISFSQTVSKMKSIPHGVILGFPRVRKTYGVLRIADFLLGYHFSYKNWNYRLKYCQNNQKKIPRMHPPCLFVTRVLSLVVMH